MECSVIIPYFNRKELLFNTLIALNKQQCEKKFEVILVDDCSKDLQEKELEKLNLNFELHYIKNDKQYSSAYSRNIGIQNAKGNIIIFMDCDLLVDTHYIENHLKFFEYSQKKEIIQIGLRKTLKEVINDNYSFNDLLKYDYSIDTRENIFKTYSYNLATIKGAWHLVWSNNISIPKKVLEKYGVFDPYFKNWGLEDVELAYRFTKHGVNIAYNPLVEAFHQFHERHYNSELFHQWKKNLDYFIEIHPELPVMLQIIFSDFFDSEKRIVLEEKDNRYRFDIWVDCFKRFESSLNNLTPFSDISRHKEKRYIHADNIDQIKNMNFPDEYEYIVICSKDNLKIISEIQCNERFSALKLFFHQ